MKYLSQENHKFVGKQLLDCLLACQLLYCMTDQGLQTSGKTHHQVLCRNCQLPRKEGSLQYMPGRAVTQMMWLTVARQSFKGCNKERWEAKLQQTSGLQEGNELCNPRHVYSKVGSTEFSETSSHVRMQSKQDELDYGYSICIKQYSLTPISFSAGLLIQQSPILKMNP